MPGQLGVIFSFGKAATAKRKATLRRTTTARPAASAETTPAARERRQGRTGPAATARGGAATATARDPPRPGSPPGPPHAAPRRRQRPRSSARPAGGPAAPRGPRAGARPARRARRRRARGADAAGSSGSAAGRGRGRIGTTGEQELVSRVEQHSHGIPVLMSAPAATAAFRALDVERIALIHAPFFSEDFDHKGVAYFEERGFEVAHVSHLMPPIDVPHPNTGSAASPAEIYEWVRGHVPSSAQAVFIGGNALRAIGVIGALEEDLRRPDTDCKPGFPVARATRGWRGSRS